MAYVTVSEYQDVEIEVDTDSIIGDISTKDLMDELKTRDKPPSSIGGSDNGYTRDNT